MQNKRKSDQLTDGNSVPNFNKKIYINQNEENGSSRFLEQRKSVSSSPTLPNVDNKVEVHEPKKANAPPPTTKSKSSSTTSQTSLTSSASPSSTRTLAPAVDKNAGTGRNISIPTPVKPHSSKSLIAQRKTLRITKVFSNLFDDVVFAISGYENPTRSEIRRKAVEMGARYKQDWDSSCTHLM